MIFEFSTVPRFTLLDIKGDIRAAERFAAAFGLTLPATTNSRASAGDSEIYHIGDSHWILRAPPQAEDQLPSICGPESPPDLLVQPVSDTWAIYRLSGTDKDGVLSVCTSLDINALPENAATFTEILGEKALIISRPEGYEFLFENSYSAFMEDHFSRISNHMPTRQD
ncbi:MAG: hypothetical protein OXF74_01375 [Rhodobacteraceae bacterium]|nr:hypothetical protein [Paracoccaceae bacterium]